MSTFLTNIIYNLNYFLSLEIYDLLKLIDVVDINKILGFYTHTDYTTKLP